MFKVNKIVSTVDFEQVNVSWIKAYFVFIFLLQFSNHGLYSVSVSQVFISISKILKIESWFSM